MPPRPGSQLEPREERLVSEFLAATWPLAPFQVRVRLGPLKTFLPGAVLSKQELTTLGSMRRWIDALVLLPSSTVLVEGAIDPDPGDISRLLYYAELFRRTPEFSERWALPLTLLLVLGIPDPIMTTMATRAGIEVRHYLPDWLIPFIHERDLRKRQATPTLRQV